MIDYRTDELMVVCGIAGKGKSHFVKWICKSLPSFIVWDVHGQHKELGILVKDLFELRKNKGKLVYIPKDTSLQHFDEFCLICFEKWNTTVIVEEAQSYFPSSPFPLKGNMGRLVSQGRNKGIGLICATRRIADLHKDIVSQAKIISFHQFWENDLKTLEANIPHLNRKEISELKDFEFMFFDRHAYKTYSPLPKVF
jgi:DNA helicase HerA-like ATPase